MEKFVLTSVRVVCRHWSRVEALPHAVQLIQMYTENISPDALTDVLRRGDVHLLHQILQATDESLNMVHHEKLRSYRFAMHLVVQMMTLEQGKLEVMKELYTRYPGSVDSETIRLVVEMVELPVLRWLHSVKRLSLKKFSWSDGAIFKNASTQGRVDEVRWVVTIFPKTVRSLEYAAQNGHLDLINFLMKHTNYGKDSFKPALRQAVVAGHLATAKHLYLHKPSLYNDFGYLETNSVEVMKWLHEVKLATFSKTTLVNAVRGGDLEMVKWLHANYSELFTPHSIALAAKFGFLEIVKFLHANRQDGCTTSAMNCAAGNGHLEIVQWLHKTRSEGCTIAAMDAASQNGHLEVLEWLHANRSEGCTPKAMEYAQNNGIRKWLNENYGLKLPEDIVFRSVWRGDFEIVKWLHFGGQGSWSKDTMDEAAMNGQLEVVKFLHEHRDDGCTKRAMDEAAANNNVEIVKFLHENRREGCTKKAMDDAAANNNVDLVKWLHVNRREGCTKQAMNSAAKNGNFELVKWLHIHRKEGCTRAAITTAALGGHLKVMKFLDANFSLDWSELAISNAVTHGHAETVKWLYTHLGQSLKANFAIRAARNGHIGVLEFMDAVSGFCENESIFNVGNGNFHPEVAEWYKDHYGNPRKRKY